MEKLGPSFWSRGERETWTPLISAGDGDVREGKKTSTQSDTSGRLQGHPGDLSGEEASQFE